MNRSVDPIGLITRKNYYVFLFLRVYFPSNKKFVTTVTGLIAIAKPAIIVSHPNILTIIIGTNVPAATGNNPVLYTKTKQFKSEERNYYA
ncbi:hypothetical protein [Candidatus Nitrosocosmicus arcticus]|uniref:hypothetical protein n=1 Tax=Candidatus Nitrosocosmicus arcticus TaxID=2035267 RepID=UPI0011A6DC89|nr:hypothetical protein [Candidatus Nitrosocosmicus arcticus]